MPLFDKQTDILKFISKTHRDIHENRIKRELQVVITTLSFYAACVIFKYEYIKKLPNNDCISCYISFVLIILAIFVSIYLWTSGESNNFNQGLAQKAEGILLHSFEQSNIKTNLSLMIDKMIQDYNGNKIIKDHKNDQEGRPSANRGKWQIIIVWCGAFISIYLIYELYYIEFIISILLSIVFLKILYVYFYIWSFRNN